MGGVSITSHRDLSASRRRREYALAAVAISSDGTRANLAEGPLSVEWVKGIRWQAVAADAGIVSSCLNTLLGAVMARPAQ